MTTQPEALRLADFLEQPLNDANNAAEDAAAELRRLHEAHDWQYRMAGERLRRVEKLEQQRDALLAALEDIERSTFDAMTAALARVAISKAEEKA